MNHKPTKSRRVWHTLKTTGLLALGSLVGCGTEDKTVGSTTAEKPAQATENAPHASPSEGQSEGAMGPTFTAADDVAYLTQLGLMRGHLWVGNELYQSNLPAMAITHMKHPKAELYSTLEEPFAIRGVAGFANELEALARGVSDNKPVAEVASAYTKLKSAISTSELGADTTSARIIGDVIVALLRTAADEYAIGVVDNKINNLHEYQDALGFTQIAAQWARSPALLESNAAIAASIQMTVSELDVMWPGLNPQNAVTQKAAKLYGAAARVEIQILSL